MEKTFNINDLFWTFQGEGMNVGRRALFVRLPFCNLSCPWCDTEFNSFKKVSISELEQITNAEPGRFAVVTGGEPTMNKQASALVDYLHKQGFHVAVESNGCFPINALYDFITISPKKFKGKNGQWGDYYVDPCAEELADEFKYVVDEDFDFSILDRHDISDGRRYTLSPQFNDMKNSFQKIESYIKENPGWRYSLQTHKWVGIA